MISSSPKKTAMAAAMTGLLAAGGSAQADIVNFSWSGTFTLLNTSGAAIHNSPTDYAVGYYPNGGTSFGAPYFPGNVGPGTTPSPFYPGAIQTAHGWYGARTPISGTLAFDTTTGGGVGTINPFFFLGDTPGDGAGTHVARFINPTFQVADTAGTIVGSMLLSWNGGAHPISIVLDGSGLFGNLIAAVTAGPTSTISGVGALPASDGLDFDPTMGVKTFPLGPSPIATKTTNTNSACAGVAITQQVNAYTINTLPAFSSCFPTSSDTIGGSPVPSGAFFGFNFNFDMTSVHYDGTVLCTSCPPPEVPLPPAVWLFGSGLLGLIGLARRKLEKLI